MCNPATSLLDQVLGGLPTDLFVVRPYEIRLELGYSAIDQHIGCFELLKKLPIALRRSDDESIDLSRHKQVDVDDFLGFVLTRVRDDDVIPGGSEGSGDRRCDLSEE